VSEDRWESVVGEAKSAQMSIAADKPAEESPSKVTQQLLIKKAAEDAIAALEHGGDGNADSSEVLSALKECGHENSAASRILATLKEDVTVDVCALSGRQRKRTERRRRHQSCIRCYVEG